METLTTDEAKAALEVIGNFYRTKFGTPVEDFVTDRESCFVAINSDQSLNITLVATGRHARIAERQIRHVKQMLRAVIHSLDYKLPNSLYVHALYYCATMTNLTVRSGHFTEPTTPAEVVVGKKLDYERVMKYPFG